VEKIKIDLDGFGIESPRRHRVTAFASASAPPMAQSVFEIYPATQSYDWGVLGKDGSKVAQFARALPNFSYEPSKPYAEVRLTHWYSSEHL
jgi:hypothetical protein